MRPSRGEVWYADLDPVRGHEQAGFRPVLIVSVDEMNHGPSRLAIMVPLTSTFRNHPAEIRLVPPEGGIRVVSYILCDQIRAITIDRLSRRLGRVDDDTMDRVTDPLRFLLDL